MQLETRKDDGLGQHNQEPNILLLTMPFGPLFQPSIGLTSLKGVIKNAGYPIDIFYLTIKFAEMIGPRAYNRIASGNPYVDLAGEWLFSSNLFGDSHAEHHARFVDDVMRRQSPRNSRVNPVPEDFIKEVMRTSRYVNAFIEGALKDVLRRKPDIIGFTSTFQQHVASLCLAKRIKEEAPDTLILMGGANCEGPMGMETIRKFPFVDAIVSGEGEIIFPKLIDNLAQGQSIDTLQGVFTQTNIDFVNVNGQALGAPPVYDMDALPMPDYRDYFHQLRHSALRQYEPSRILFETSRGCWWGERNHCTFCGLNGETMAYRSKSAERAIEEIVTLTETYPNYPVWVVDNILDMKYFNDFIPELQRLNLDLELFYEVKANLRKDQLIMMREAGIKHLQPGIESMSNHVLKLMRKGVSWLQNVQVLKWGRELGMEIYWNIIWGFPGETAEDYAEMAQILPYIHHFQPPYGSAQIRLDRFSPNHNEAEAMGFINVRPALPYEYIYPFEEHSLNKLAYHFNYDYTEARDVRQYTAPVSQAVHVWRNAVEESAVFLVDLETHLLVWDFRDVAKQSLTVLTGLQRQLYLECDEIRNRRYLKQYLDSVGADDADIDALLAPLLESSILLADGQSYLAIAVRLGRYEPNLAILQKLHAAAQKTEVVLEETTAYFLMAEERFGDHYFGLSEQGQPMIYFLALSQLIAADINAQLSEQPYQTIGGITIDM